MITTEELARIRTAAIGDMLGDSTELDKLGPAATIFRLCRELELSRKHAVTMSEVAAAAWDGEIPSPLPGHTHMTEEEFTERYNCPWCGGSGHIDDCVEDRTRGRGVEMKPNDTDKKVMPEPSNLGAALSLMSSGQGWGGQRRENNVHHTKEERDQ